MNATVTLPLFPLGSVLFPGGLLHLHIFEVRYLKLIRECVDSQTPFGVIHLKQGQEVRRPGEQIALAGAGTLAQIVEFQAIQPALFKIKCTGTHRFRLKSAQQDSSGLWLGDVDLREEDPAIPVPEHLTHCARDLERIIAELRNRSIPMEQWPFDGNTASYEDCAWVANRLCELLPMTSDMREQLLGVDNPLMRLELVNDLMSSRTGL
jgi:Lon protease-like protein